MRTTISLGGVDVPCFELGSGSPRVSVLGGIHGCEYSSIAAVTRIMRELETEDLRGTADAVLDLHGGDLVEALEPFALYHDNARELALAFGLPYVVDSTGSLEGSTSGAA